MPKILLLICVYFICSFGVTAIEADNTESNFDILLNHTNYGVADGLSQDTVTAIVEDKEGYVWVGTINGLNRFDGNEFKQFYAGDDAKSLPSSFIRNLLIDDNGVLLVGTDKGLVQFDKETESFSRNSISTQIGDQAIWSISKQDDKIFIGLNGKFVTYEESNNQYLIFEDDNLKEIKNILKFNGIFYIRNYEGSVFTNNTNTTKKIISKSNDIIIFKNNVIAATDQGIYIINEKIKKISKLKLIDLSIDYTNMNNVIGLYENKIFSLKKNNNKITWTSLGELQVEGEKFIKSFISANGGNLYISNYNDGFIKISPENNLVKKIKDIPNNIWSISEYKDDIFLVNDGNKIYVYDKSIVLKKTIKTSLPYGPKSILVINKKAFVGTKSGLYLINIENGKERKLNNELIVSIKYNKDLEQLYSSNFKGEVQVLSITGEVIEEINTKFSYPIYDMVKIDSKLWIASQAGLLIWENNKITEVFNEDIVFNIAVKNNKVYFGTRSSIYSTDKNIFSKPKIIFNRKKVIYSIAFVDNIMVASSNREVYIIDTNTNITHTLSVENGVLKDYNTQSLLTLNKSVLFGGGEGLSLVEPKKILSAISENSIATIKLSDFLLFNTPVRVGSKILKKPINNLDQIILKHSDYPFTIKFNVLGKNNNDFEFFYYLEGLERNWLSTKGNNNVTYTNLSADKYTFKLYAKNRLSGRKTDIKSIKILVTPPWWLSLEAKLVYGLFILALIIISFKIIIRRREIQKQIAQSEERLKLSLWGSGDEMWDWDIESGKIYRSNIWGSLDFPQDGRRSGNADEESNIHPLDRDRVTKALNDHFNAITDHFEIAYRVKARNQQWIWILDRAKIVERDQKDQPLRMTGTIKDINNIKQAEEQLRLFARAIENISEGMFILDEKYQFVEVNNACCELTASTKEKFVHEILNFTRYPASYSEQIRNLLKQQGRWSGEIEASKGKDGFFLIELTIDAIYNEQGETSHYVGVFSDITRRKQQEEELRKLTNNDLLTGLPNRSSLQVTLSNLVKKDIHHTLMVLDLDNFKRINDSLGHQIGDDLLIGVAKRIQSTIPKHASLYRLGGDEFALLVDQLPDIGSCAAIATQVINCLKPAFTVNNDSLVLGISIGIVLYPEDEQNEQALLRKADIAMYHAKSGGGNRYQFYSESLNQNALRQLEIESLIREALKDDLFEVYYQPKVDVKKDRLTGMEALVRLNHPKLGLIGPNEFIPLAEENGLIVEIGDVVMRKACFAAQKWLELGLFSGRVAVNLSSKQFALPDLLLRIESILRLTKLPAEHLELEITESTVIKNPEQAIKVMQQLAKMGISLALDDFGTGYSSLSYLKRFPINCLKIDKTFVDDIDKSDRDLKMVDSIITIAHNMGLTVVGEGVEQTSQLNILKALNCEEIQGYIYSKPIKEADFELMLTADKLKFDTLNGRLIKK